MIGSFTKKIDMNKKTEKYKELTKWKTIYYQGCKVVNGMAVAIDGKAPESVSYPISVFVCP